VDLTFVNLAEKPELRAAMWAVVGLPLTTSGLLDVPGALVPVHVSVEQDHAVYNEPNVWVHHRARPAARAR
jgi:hypothetical protein